MIIFYLRSCCCVLRYDRFDEVLLAGRANGGTRCAGAAGGLGTPQLEWKLMTLPTTLEIYSKTACEQKSCQTIASKLRLAI